MGFAEKFVASLQSSNLRDDAFHHDLDAIAAAALAGDLGSLLCRVKYADGTINKLFEGNSGNLTQLLRIWTARVIQKGRERKWVEEGAAWDAHAAQALYRRVAERSLAYWLDGKCTNCSGTGISSSRQICAPCKGIGRAEINGGGFERERTLDMVSDLEGLLQAHHGRAAGRLGQF
ncbi:hypothetical protein [Janthinobacterium sp. NKUCC06_STL]|uniref:hypothetical protein n=1 Tax=Janthinobacterium sp. NKUCC06_STL TaxID=2842127 RepID=UPI001C5BE303|nr:hypothetical protein [Janthinobacterium sp. NKUCC06_STL]MBW3512909.1 hypothetical protein [Janthinobacterium sp. NKUCC06_STL]